MSQKASNKYLFNQIIDCKNCQHERNNFCLVSQEQSFYYLCDSMRDGVTQASRDPIRIEPCGPLGKFYQAK